MTAVLDAPLDLADVLGEIDWDASLPCEWVEYDCSEPATVRSKACEDDRPYMLCNKHLAHLRRWFAANKWAVCTCGRPFVHFETHYDIREL